MSRTTAQLDLFSLIQSIVFPFVIYFTNTVLISFVYTELRPV